MFYIHRGKIFTRYDDEITRLYAHTRGKLRSVTREFEDLQHRLRTRLQEVNYGRLPESLKIYNIVYGRAFKKYRIRNYHSHVSASSCTIFKDVVVSFVSHGMGTGHIARCLKK
jgi:hypothetical protein